MILKNKKILVTGGAGFIGSHLVDSLVHIGAQVAVIDNLSTGVLDNLAQSKPEIEFHQTDIRDFDKINSIIQKQDIVFHLAANADVPRSVRDPDYDFQNNVIGGFNVIKSCLKSNVEKLIFSSSAAVYGEPKTIPIKEDSPTNPVSLYGVSKLFTEKLGFAYHRSSGLPFVAVRIFNNFGVRQRRFVMYDLLKKLYLNKPELEVLGTGENVRDYCYVSDGVKFFTLVAESDQVIGEAINLVGGKPVKIKDMIKTLANVAGYPHIPIRYTGVSWPGDIVQLIGDNAKAKRILKFNPQIKLKQGMTELHQWLSQQD